MSAGLSELARAKVNLTLHVGARRDDGYHELDSLVVFADIGDELEFKPTDKKTTLTINGSKELRVNKQNSILRTMKFVSAPPHIYGWRSIYLCPLELGAGVQMPRRFCVNFPQIFHIINWPLNWARMSQSASILKHAA